MVVGRSIQPRTQAYKASIPRVSAFGGSWLCGVHGKEAVAEFKGGRVLGELHAREQRLDIGRGDKAAIDLAEDAEPLVFVIDVDGVLQEGRLCRGGDLW